MKNSSILYHDLEGAVSSMPDAQAGQLFKALFAYEKRGELPQGAPEVQVAFNFMRTALDANRDKYDEQIEKNRQNGSLGGRPKKPSGIHENPKNPGGFSENPSKAKKAVYEYDYDSDYDTTPPNGGVVKRAGKPRFTPPTLDEVAAYVAERGSFVDPQGFIDFYASKGWMVGKTPMKDWKAACRNAEKWERFKRPTASERPVTQRQSFADVAARMKQEGKL